MPHSNRRARIPGIEHAAHLDIDGIAQLELEGHRQHNGVTRAAMAGTPNQATSKRAIQWRPRSRR